MRVDLSSTRGFPQNLYSGKDGTAPVDSVQSRSRECQRLLQEKVGTIYSPPLHLSLLYFWYVAILSLPPFLCPSILSSLLSTVSKTSYGTKYSRNEKLCANQINNLVIAHGPDTYIATCMFQKHLTMNFAYLFQRFHDKTHNEWEERESFVKKAGKYDMLAMDYKATIVSVWRR